jgi:hypothetical protein
MHEGALEIVASSLPPIFDPDIAIEIAVIGGAWKGWPRDADRVLIGTVREGERSNFVQIRVRLGDMVCAWLQVAPCDPPPDENRDQRLIAQYLDANTFLLWLRSLLADTALDDGGGDWDSDGDTPVDGSGNRAQPLDPGAIPTVEEILRAWARDATAFRNADQKVRTYLSELESRASQTSTPSNLDLLRRFRKTWETLAGELQ